MNWKVLFMFVLVFCGAGIIIAEIESNFISNIYERFTSSNYSDSFNNTYKKVVYEWNEQALPSVKGLAMRMFSDCMDQMSGAVTRRDIELLQDLCICIKNTASHAFNETAVRNATFYTGAYYDYLSEMSSFCMDK